MIDGASEAIRFYEQAFGASEIFRVSQPDGKILHAEIKVGDSVVMLGDTDEAFGAPTSLGGTTVGLHVYVEDVDSCFARAVGAGARALQPVGDMFYGDRMGMLEDPFGHIWVLLTHKEELSPEEIKTRGEAMFGGEKI
ncbi:VOC family protein [Rubrobacter xylanophilus]|uniref:VOC family protein n=1 Tax=Rubrobacter xylanophilus TaxID=49319 RepID=UPI001C63EB20|nr:VOC family protein [Rubrobacter xylanophilus]